MKYRNPMQNNINENEKNLYADSDLYVYWFRFIFGLIGGSLVAISLSLFLFTNWMVAFIFLPSLMVFALMNATFYFTGAHYKKFDIEKHNQTVSEFISKKNFPNVDILLPIAGEQWETLERTWINVSKLDYPNFEVLVLDDKGDDFVKKKAKKFGFKYYSRPDKGVNKKAGNLRYGLKYAKGDYFVILDADFAPNPEFLNNLLPYFDDDRVGIVQSPQFFDLNDKTRTTNSLQYDAGIVQEEFYAYIQIARDGVNATVCVGSNAIYSRKHLDKIGGIAQIDHSEDIMTGIKLQESGDIVKYIPINLASGECPDDLQSYFSQQQRWCRGNLDLIQDIYFWKKKLNLKQKIAYLNGYLYYIFTFFEKILWIAPVVLVFFYSELIDIIHVFWIIPSVIYNIFVTKFTRKYNKRFWSVADQSNGFIYGWTWVSSLFSKDFKWIASGKQRNDLKPDYKAFLIYLFIFSFVWVSISIYSINYSLNQIITLKNLIDYSPIIIVFIIQIYIILKVCYLHFSYVIEKIYAPSFNSSLTKIRQFYLFNRFGLNELTTDYKIRPLSGFGFYDESTVRTIQNTPCIIFDKQKKS